MWTQNWRDTIWNELSATPWDLIIVGGGITGAGVLREAVRMGYRALLVEASDFAAGTSSRSSKLVHGGLRYLKNAQIRTTLESVSERERLLRDGKGLINRLGFLYAMLEGDSLPGWVFGLGLSVYDLLARQWTHRKYDDLDMRELCPPLTTPALRGGYRYFDAQTDDARLVLRVIRAAVRAGGAALNYARAEQLLRTADGRVRGVVLRDQAPAGAGRTAEALAPVVVNAAGPWADDLRIQLNKQKRLRALRGSHLVLPARRLPLTRAVSYLHPADGRPVFVIPWEGVTLVGTTDVEQGAHLPVNPAISPAEAEYLLAMVTHVFPQQEITFDDVQATFSGIRAVVDTGKADPSKEAREHAIWQEAGLLTVSGGKLTTFRVMARDALNAARALLPERPPFDREKPLLNGMPEEPVMFPAALREPARLRLLGRHAADAPALLAAAPDELMPIGETPYLWAELRWAVRAEGVVHLDDLLLRRVRLGLLLPEGGLREMPRIRAIVQPELGWDDARWEAEAGAYARLWRARYSLREI